MAQELTFLDRPMNCKLPSASYTAYTPGREGKEVSWPSAFLTGLSSAAASEPDSVGDATAARHSMYALRNRELAQSGLVA